MKGICLLLLLVTSSAMSAAQEIRFVSFEPTNAITYTTDTTGVYAGIEARLDLMPSPDGFPWASNTWHVFPISYWNVLLTNQTNRIELAALDWEFIESVSGRWFYRIRASDARMPLTTTTFEGVVSNATECVVSNLLVHQHQSTQTYEIGSLVAHDCTSNLLFTPVDSDGLVTSYWWWFDGHYSVSNRPLDFVVPPQYQRFTMVINLTNIVMQRK